MSGDGSRHTDWFGGTPRSQWRANLETLVTSEFRTALAMTPDEPLPLDQNYFDLGLTSLRVTEIKQRLEATLGVPVDTTALFGSPTVERLLDHLIAQALHRSPHASPKERHPPAETTRKTLVDSLLKDVYQP